MPMFMMLSVHAVQLTNVACSARWPPTFGPSRWAWANTSDQDAWEWEQFDENETIKFGRTTTLASRTEHPCMERTR